MNSNFEPTPDPYHDNQARKKRRDFALGVALCVACAVTVLAALACIAAWVWGF